MTGNILIRCPAMAVLSTWRCWIRECQQLVCPDNEIVLEDGTKIEFTLIIPKVLVRWKSWGKWLVDEVTAEGVTQYGGRISLTLDESR
ncbi:hypothetical protein KIH39_09055 [Telmatocola sphagniphila]|uniref:Uncharacterized protein n=1 Tax=Telmatocola sphagniphila TaxID=1123043 RepID=A0A8E6B946_9BACT|nr:hypothetical protein [Telmatocola sphagniphila]QVL34036.1 hypothetical protein KIH39_09055 [Telmatocola sphagniphila]